MGHDLRRFALTIAALATALALGALVPLSRQAPLSAAPLLIACVLIVPLLLRVVHGQFDLFEPLVVLNLSLFVMYVLRPLAVIRSVPPHFFKGIDITAQVAPSMLTAAVAVAAVQIGYFTAGSRAKSENLTVRSEPRVARYAIAVAALGLLAYGAFLHSSGGVGAATSLLKGRAPGQDQLFRNSTAYLYAAPQLLWPAATLLWLSWFTRGSKWFAFGAITVSLPLLILSLGQGSRINLIPIVLAPIILSYLVKRRRPSATAVLVVSYLIFTLGIGYIRDHRVQGSVVSSNPTLAEIRRPSLIGDLTHPEYEVHELIGRGVDNDMFESLAAEQSVVGPKIKASPGDFAFRLLTKPIPSVLWPGKPHDPDEHLTNVMFPNEPTRESSSTGLVGSCYLFGGLAGVAAGMAVLGRLFGRLWRNFQLTPGNRWSQVLLVTTLLLAPIILRGGLSDTLTRVLFVLGPLLIVRKRLAHGTPDSNI